MRYILAVLTILATLGTISPSFAQPDPVSSPLDRAPTDDIQPLDPEDTQSELGEIEIIDRPAQTRRQPDVQLLVRSSVFSSSNITALEALKQSDTVFTNTAHLLITPKLGENTRLIASAGGGIVRFASEGDSNYNIEQYNIAVQQRLAPGTFGQLGWVQDTLRRPGSGDLLTRDNAVQLIVGRQDQLGKQARLDSFYEFRSSFTNPSEDSRITNTIGTRLRYDISPQVQGALDYRLSFKNFTQGVSRSDTEHQISAIVIYNINPDVFLAGSASYLFGRSSNAAIDINNLSFGLSLGFNLPLF
ncbi:outer membrane beta-barrel protein [Leptolyngbya boryana CZ1]|uniref:Outer membrane beta-barrel protein n=1 Tax=Leptolyngbya boryana CZ1 TaxID=3060204 RepID=A0AA96WU20_LEPBY|nr:outer membrane beta-barrel protein [Leptolyngbya boryana]WNZ44164.1 outer membrane beta-barrel protein [Leptolyngbya boryana CZ1]